MNKKTEKHRSWVKPLLGLGMVAILIVAFVFFDTVTILEKVLNWIEGLGAWGMVAYISIYFLATVFLVPGFILTVGAGFVFGVVQGSILASVASTLGATGAFLVGRYLMRDWVANKVTEEYARSISLETAKVKAILVEEGCDFKLHDFGHRGKNR